MTIVLKKYLGCVRKSLCKTTANALTIFKPEMNSEDGNRHEILKMI